MLADLGVSASRAQGLQRSTPTAGYYAAFGMFYDGDYADALKSFKAESRSSIKNAQSRWIDSICYETMCGECYFQMGILDKALAHYTAALQIYRAFPDWMMKVQFPPAIRTGGAGARKAVPWGASSRGSQLGAFPSSMLIGQGQIDMNEVVQRGGIVQQANLFSITPQEIVRATSLAIRRRATLLGPVARFDPLMSDVLAALSRPVGPPNHWSESWSNLERGLAMAAGGKDTQAIGYLQRAVLAAGEFDHPLTSVALLELGRMALQRGEFPAATTFLEEATFAAVNYPDYGVLEEAFRYRVIAHLMSNGKGFFTPLDAAIQWAKVKNLRQLRASLLLLAAENHAVLGQSRQAGMMLDEARATIGRRKMGQGAIGARLSYLMALVAFQQKRMADGNAALSAAMGYMQHGSLWLFHIALADDAYTNGSATPRVAMDLFNVVLRDPQPADWASDPMESLASLVVPHAAALEHWFEVALDRKETQTALEISDRARRHRFFSSLEFGGRLESLRWIFEGPTSSLPQAAVLQRQDLLARYPDYDKFSQRAKTIQAALAKLPLAAADQAAMKTQAQGLAELAGLGNQQEAILREVALKREPAALVFPPLRSLAEVQKSLPEKQAILGFFATSRRLHGFLLNNERCTVWPIGSIPALAKQIQAMLREMGNYDANHELTVKDLGDAKWKQSAKQVLEALLKDSPADFTQSFDELVIIPDGLLWHVPFEALQVTVGGTVQPLTARFRMRYAPTLSLATSPDYRREPTERTAVVVGKLWSRDEGAVAEKAYEALATVAPGTTALRLPLPAPSSIYSTLFQRLIVLDDIPSSDHNPYGLAILSMDRGKAGSSLADWLLLPWGGPNVVVLPGFHTSAEDSLKRLAKNLPGNDVFLTVCGLMANGARTVLLSRWRSGGQTSFDLVREFVQELPHTSPADAWQRAILLTVNARVAVEAEPRLKRAMGDEPPKAAHPFFWAGYLLVDSGAAAEPAEPKAEAPVLKPAKPAQPKAEAPVLKPAKPAEP
jgi:CHAT domain-containing protein